MTTLLDVGLAVNQCLQKVPRQVLRTHKAALGERIRYLGCRLRAEHYDANLQQAAIYEASWHGVKGQIMLYTLNIARRSHW